MWAFAGEIDETKFILFFDEVAREDAAVREKSVAAERPRRESMMNLVTRVVTRIVYGWNVFRVGDANDVEGLERSQLGVLPSSRSLHLRMSKSLWPECAQCTDVVRAPATLCEDAMWAFTGGIDETKFILFFDEVARENAAAREKSFAAERPRRESMMNLVPRVVTRIAYGWSVFRVGNANDVEALERSQLGVLPPGRSLHPQMSKSLWPECAQCTVSFRSEVTFAVPPPCMLREFTCQKMENGLAEAEA